MKLENFKLTRCIRRGGGVKIGMIVHSPCAMVDESIFTHRWMNIHVCFGLVAWEFAFDINYNFKTD